jgi:diguanylate cyclase (GGDEF)-like protein
VSPNFPLSSPGMSFGDAADAVLDHLQEVLPLGCWAVTRQDGQRLRFLHMRDTVYGFVDEESSAVPHEQHALVSVAMHRSDGTLFGTLCGFDPTPQPVRIAEHSSLLNLLAQLLTSILESDLVITEHLRTLEQAQRATELDELTGLLNRSGWDRYLEQEEERHVRFGDSSAVIIAGLDKLAEITEHRGADAAERYIVNAGNALRNTVRGADVVARIGEDEFGVVVTAISAEECELLVDRIHDAFRAAGVSGSIGSASYSVASGFAGAIASATTVVADDKSQRRTRAGRLVLVR